MKKNKKSSFLKSAKNVLPPELVYDPERLMDETEAARFLGFTIRALQAWRQRGEGPVFIKISARAVRYRRKDLIDWIQSLRQ